MHVETRMLRNDEVSLLKEFLYEAIFIPEGVTPPPRDIVEKTELRVYTDDFGTRQGDNCLVAVIDNQIVCAIEGLLRTEHITCITRQEWLTGK